jgi:hypothetical protein
MPATENWHHSFASNAKYRSEKENKYCRKCKIRSYHSRVSEFNPWFLMGSVLLIYFVFFFVLSYYVSLCSEFRVVMCNVQCIKTMFGSSLPPIICRKVHDLFTLFGACLRILLCNTYCVRYFSLVVFVLYTKCCQFLWIIHSWWPFRCSLTFIFTQFVAFSCINDQ